MKPAPSGPMFRDLFALASFLHVAGFRWSRAAERFELGAWRLAIAVLSDGRATFRSVP